MIPCSFHTCFCFFARLLDKLAKILVVILDEVSDGVLSVMCLSAEGSDSHSLLQLLSLGLRRACLVLPLDLRRACLAFQIRPAEVGVRDEVDV